MSVDRISNMVSSIKNSAMADRDVLEIPYTRECEDIAKVLKDNKFIEEIKIFKKEKSSSKMLSLKLLREDGKIKLSQTKRVSKPGMRVYKGHEELRPVLQGLGVLIVSTPRGIMDGRVARKKKLGGEIICEVY